MRSVKSKMPFIIIFVTLSFLSAFGAGVGTNDDTTTRKSVECSDIKDCDECSKEKCHFVFTSCENVTKNDTKCMEKVPEKLENCTIITETNCTLGTASSPVTESTSIKPETTTNGSTGETTATASTSSSTGKTSSTTVSSTTVPTELTTKAEPHSLTTPIPPVTSTSAEPTASHTTNPSVETSPNSVKPTSQTNGKTSFDTGSFIGGIVLTLGLMAIAFVGYKFYRARTEHNYHTLHETVHM